MSEELDTMTAEEINQAFKAAGDSVSLINAVVADPDATDESGTKKYKTDEDPDAKDLVGRNVAHLRIISGKDWYSSDSESRSAPADKTSIASAISAGDSFVNA